MIKILGIFLFSFNLYASTLILIGGGNRPKEALTHFLVKVKNGPIYILPWGTQYPDESFMTIKSELEYLGAADVRCFCQEEFTAENLLTLSHAGGIYFPGGDQNKIMERIFQSNTKTLIHKLYQSGIPVAGTSAGTAIQTNPMLTGTGSETSEGLGLLSHFIVDQHFLVRNREHRLLEALEVFPTFYGMGIDESMSAVIENSTHITALGPSFVTIYLRDENKIKKLILADQQSIQLSGK